MTRNAPVVGGSGLVGGNLIRRLGDTPHWRVKSLSRRPVDMAVPVHYLAADLLDRTRLQASVRHVEGVVGAIRIGCRGFTRGVMNLIPRPGNDAVN
jgi:nucleoside-diphosphate-sugar epimerase